MSKITEYIPPELISGEIFGESLLHVHNNLWVQKVENIIKNEYADYIVIDFMDFILPYIVNPYVTEENENSRISETDIVYYLENWSPDYLQKCFIGFQNLIEKYYDKDHIIVIRNFIPKYYVASGKQPNQYKDKTILSRARLLSEYEKKFIKSTGCKRFNLAKYYFYDKQPGVQVIPTDYEDEFYKDIAFKLISLGEGLEVEDLPDPEISLQRVLNYKYDVWCVREIFLSDEKFLDSFIIACPYVFLKDHKEELVNIKDVNNFGESEDIKNYLEKKASGIQNELRQCLIAYLYIEYAGEKISGSVNEDWVKFLFQNGIVGKNVKKIIRSTVPKSVFSTKSQITPENAGYYYAFYVKGYDETKAESYVKKGTLIKPEIIDCQGACLSFPSLLRHVGDSADIVANNIFYHTPIWCSEKSKISYPDDLFKEPVNLHDKNVKAQFEGNLFDIISNSEAEWLLVDLYSLITPRTFRYKGLVYTDFNMKISETLHAEKVNPWSDEKILGNWNEILKKTDPWCELIKNKYGDNIIYVNTIQSLLWIGDDNKIYRWKKNKEIERKNEFVRQGLDYLYGKTGGYIIDLSHFMSDQLGYHNNASVHFELHYYRIMNQMIRQIMSTKPEQKLFTEYPGDIHIDRIMRLRDSNKKWLMRMLFSKDLDRLVTYFDDADIDTYRSMIVEMYDSGAYDINDILEKADLISDKLFCDKIRNVWEKANNDSSADIRNHSLKELPIAYRSFMESEF